jgi:para-nitrobenzyl esterase
MTLTAMKLRDSANHRRLKEVVWIASLSLAMLSTGLGFPAVAELPAGPVVTVTGGKVQGGMLSSPGGAFFKGIPFAQPPIGELRWREPQPLKPWTGLRQATDYGNTCMQANSGWNKNSADKASEDCLYLNIWTPEWPSKNKRAVMVWMHGGGNGGGSALGAGAIEPPFDGESLARHGVVLVTIQYRLGVFGFMGHPELTAESPHHASGAYGLLDQLAALQWVHDNIAKFGGDPGNVTLFGQSAGAQDTAILLASPLAKGLINKAIAESGSPMISDKRLQTPAQMEQIGVILASALHAPSTGSIAYLRSLSATAIFAASGDLRKGLSEQHLILDVGMDGYVVPQFSPGVYRAGKELAIPVIFGSNGREGGGGGPGGPRPGAAPPNPEQLQAAAKGRVVAAYQQYPDLTESALKSYGYSGTANDLSTDPDHGSAEQQFGTDLFMRCETVTIAAWHSAVAPTYQYEFNAGNAAHPPVHSAELDFVFGYLRDQASDPVLSKVSEQMQKYWTNFARTGDPNGPGLPEWVRFSKKNTAYMDFSNKGSIPKSALRSATCAIYAEKLNRDTDARR